MSARTPENAVKRAVREHLRGQGFFTFALMAGMGAHPGVADLCAVRGGSVFWVECKAPKGRQSPPQAQFQRDVEAHGGTYILCRSVDDLLPYVGGCLALDSAT